MTEKFSLPLHKTVKHSSSRRYSIDFQPYYYNQTGQITSNPIPYQISSISPLKYRPSSSSMNIKGSQSSSKRPLSQQKTLLHSSLWEKQVYVLKDGSAIKENNCWGFRYKIQYKGFFNREILRNQTLNFLREASAKFKTTVCFLFTKQGKFITSLAEIPKQDKIVIVGATPKFQGVKVLKGKNRPAVFSDSSIYDRLQQQFSRQDLSVGLSPRRKGHLDIKPHSRKTVLQKFRNKSVKVQKLVPSSTRNKKQNKVDMLIKLGPKLAASIIKIDKIYPRISQQQINLNAERFNFQTAEVIKIFAQFKTLLLMSVAQDTQHDITKGIGRATFIQSVMGGGKSSNNTMIERLFDTIDHHHTGYLPWPSFIQAMSLFRFGSLDQQVDMLFRIHDTRRSGSFSFEQIKSLCLNKLETGETDDIIQYLAQSFAKSLFQITGRTKDQGLKKADFQVQSQNKRDSALIEMFCSFNVKSL